MRTVITLSIFAGSNDYNNNFRFPVSAFKSNLNAIVYKLIEPLFLSVKISLKIRNICITCLMTFKKI